MVWIPRRHRSEQWNRILEPPNWKFTRFGGCCCSSGPPFLACSPCNIPEANLTLSWVNSLFGNGSTSLTYSSPPPSWNSACSNGLLYKLLCTGGVIELRVIYFTTGSCPTGTQQYCSNVRVTPNGLTLASYTCSPFSVTFNAISSACPAIVSAGYTQFVVTYP